jgi:hypothetical protein
MEDYSRIYDMPTVPENIIESINNGTFAIFIGAGVSSLAGCIGWSDLAMELVDQCYEITTEKMGQNSLNFRQKERLRESKDYKKTITIVKRIFEQNGNGKQFDEVVCNLLNKSNRADYPDIYSELRGLRGLFLTTNVDNHFDKLFSTNVYLDLDFDNANPDRDKLYHVHGSINKPTQMVLTLDEYFRRYSNDKLVSFLDIVFTRYSILFLGYGLSEFEVLDYLFTRFTKGKGQQHFMLRDYYEGEESYLKLDQYYYNTMNITVVAYKADDKGHRRLGNIIRDWVRAIKLRSDDLPRRYEEIDHLVRKVEND